LIDVVGCEKILWGTDFPLRIYPAKQSHPDFSLLQEEVLSNTNLNPSQRNALFGGNLLSLLPC
jgi:predicted TIM-barrel fold metal-dependent hydrolase